MSFLLHGSTGHTGMGWVDLVPRAGKLYIGGLYALYQGDLIDKAGITHVLSVIDYDPLLQEKFRHLKQVTFHIRSEDHPNTNLLQDFTPAVHYIDTALNVENGGVFIHCAMGKSRSATLICAYLIWKYNLTPAAALDQLCEGRPVCDPNPGFKEQLEVWREMCGVSGEEEKRRVYEKWEKDRFTGEVWEWDARLDKKREQSQERVARSKL
ncbi:protein-tyrosine phosphatase-like protein [Alternaria rosae]|uniref:protein-tyrosine phosphatase-like protein n=1 Tax=Alternaria rosae TaxID=1187941 RepID=UPI001E8E4A26|nr:protein-tyrosine phosphatase-like protein [Alternaria rosae]KAH6883057.1 protein-tyrosine phosphatase-like protein [Alternaria rosae]